MDKDTIKAGIDSAAEQARETVDLMSDKLDNATQCVDRKRTELKDRMKEGVTKAADRVQETVTSATDRIREHMKK